MRGGKGHKYWSHFPEKTQQEIEDIGAKAYDALFRPPLKDPFTTLDLPVAGRGYNQLPFAFDLVNLCNNFSIPDRSDNKRIGEAPADDSDGSKTVEYLKVVWKRLQLVTTNKPGSLGLHPAVYFYAMSGNFLPNAFLATVEFTKLLHDKNKKDQFTMIRGDFEDYLFKNKFYQSYGVETWEWCAKSRSYS